MTKLFTMNPSASDGSEGRPPWRAFGRRQDHLLPLRRSRVRDRINGERITGGLGLTYWNKWGIFIGVEKNPKIQTFEPNEPWDIQVTYVLAYHGFPNKAGC